MGFRISPSPVNPGTPSLVGLTCRDIFSDPVDWTSEFRCFMRDGRVEAWSPYLSFGRPTWKAECAGKLPSSLGAIAERLLSGLSSHLPPAFVVDFGVLEDGRWAVVEFNPAWCSGILGASVPGVFSVIQRSALSRCDASREELRWSRLSSL